LCGFNPPIHEALGYEKSLHDALAEVHAKAIRGDAPDPSDAHRLVADSETVLFSGAFLRWNSSHRRAASSSCPWIM
jgi:DNA helicase-2/ATP-dependent DNA helicase PcrA